MEVIWGQYARKRAGGEDKFIPPKEYKPSSQPPISEGQYDWRKEFGE
jgi:hypothetical protein